MPAEIIAVAATVGSLTVEQAKAVQGLSEFGKTAVQESSALARYMGKILGTVPEDAVGLILGDPLRAIRTYVAGQYDRLIEEKLWRQWANC